MTKFIEERVNDLEQEIAELKLIVHELRKPSTVVEVSASVVEDTIEFEGKQYKKVDRLAREGDVVVLQASTRRWFSNGVPRLVIKQLEIRDDDGDCFGVYCEERGRTPETVDVYELIVEDKPKTPNELRGEIIEKAKVFVAKNQCVRPIFKINEKKRAVTVLIYGAFSKKLVFKGLAKCNPSDVFNEHIGKAISLGRALNLDVSEFEQAVQPTFDIGQIIEFINFENNIESFQIVEVDDEKVWFIDNDGCQVYVYKSGSYKGDGTYKPKIINDTNAIYKV